MWTAAAIEHCRLATIAARWRLTAARRAPINSPSEWNGWTVINPDPDRTRYHERAAAKLCTRCGKHPPRPDRKTCERCAKDQRDRAAALRARRLAAGCCVQCGAAAGGQTRCEKCRRSYRAGGKWAKANAE